MAKNYGKEGDSGILYEKYRGGIICFCQTRPEAVLTSLRRLLSDDTLSRAKKAALCGGYRPLMR